MSEKTFVPIQLSTLVGDQALTFDVYIKLDERCILYVRHGDAIETDRLKGLKKKKVRKLFIESQQEPVYQNFLDSLLSGTQNLEAEQKAGVVSSVAENATEAIYTRPQSQEAYGAAEKATSSLIDVVSKNQDVLLAILKRDDKVSDNSRDAIMHMHSVNVSSLAVSFGETLGFNRGQLTNLGVAGMFHDVGYAMMKEEDKGLFFKDFKAMTPAEQIIYKQHPFMGAEGLQDKPFANAEVLGLIMTHEERVNGSGFPKGGSASLNALQECHALCCHYDRQVTCLGIDPETVINDIMVNYIGGFNLDTLKKFKTFMKNVYKLG